MKVRKREEQEPEDAKRLPTFDIEPPVEARSSTLQIHSLYGDGTN